MVTVPPIRRFQVSLDGNDGSPSLGQGLRCCDGGPGALLRTITFPVHQVLQPPSSATHIKDVANGIGRSIIDDPLGWGTRSGGNRRAGDYRLNTRHMSLTTAGLSTFSTGGGPLNWVASLQDLTCSGISLVDSHTFCPGV